MTTSQHSYQSTRAAMMLREAIARYTAQHPGGLRALAQRLEIKQATVLSHMANGRMAIPLDRASQLANALDINATSFSLAVLEQRAPDVYGLLDNTFAFEAATDRSPIALAIIREVAKTEDLTGDHLELIKTILRRKDPDVRLVTGQLATLTDVIHSFRPLGLEDGELDGLIAAATVLLQD